MFPTCKESRSVPSPKLDPVRGSWRHGANSVELRPVGDDGYFVLGTPRLTSRSRNPFIDNTNGRQSELTNRLSCGSDAIA